MAASVLDRSGGGPVNITKDRPRIRWTGEPGRRRAEADFDFDAWLAVATERADPIMAWLGLIFALLVGYPLVVRLRPPAALALEVVGWAIWVVFLLDFVAKLWLAPDRWRFLRRHWLAVLMLLVPALRLLRLVALLRVGRALPAARVVSSSYRATGTARRLLRSRLGYLGALSVLMAIAVAELAFLFEQGHGDTFGSFGDALLWAVAVVVAMQGDPVPHTAAGRLVMLTGFAVGLVLVASVAGTVGAFLIDDRHERASSQPDP